MNKINYYRPQAYIKKGVGFWKKLKTAIKTKRFWTWVVRLAALGFATLAFLFIWYSKDLPDPNRLLSRQIAQSTKILSRDGDLLYEVHGEYKRTLIPYSEMNDYVKNATIAIED
jgi:membrane carboxypeptidase/penicillin-binding protein